MHTGRINPIKIHELIICQFLNTVNLTHLKKAPSQRYL